MANTASAKKAVRASARKKRYNDVAITRFKDARKVIRKAVVAGDKKSAEKAMPAAMKAIDKASKGNALHQNTAARYKSRIAKAIAKLT